MSLNIANEYRESADRRDFRSSTRGMLARLWSDEALRAHPDTDGPALGELNAKIHEGLALGGLLVPEEHGGFGATREFAAVAAEELGAGLAPYDLVGSCAAAQLLTSAGAAGHEWLTRLADESRPFVFAWPGRNASWNVSDVALAHVTDGRVSGDVTDVASLTADRYVVLPATAGDQLGVALIDGAQAAEALSVTQRTRADVLRTLGDLSVRDAPCSFVPVPERGFTEALLVSAILLAAEMVGAARSSIEGMVDYGLARRQFGQPIVTFKALKHAVVDSAVDFERARASVYRAARRADATTSDSTANDVAEAVMFGRIAKASASTALRSAAKLSIQLHGGMGFTWENLSHRYLKKWATVSQLLGSPDAQRRLIYAHSQAAAS